MRTKRNIRFREFGNATELEDGAESLSRQEARHREAMVPLLAARVDYLLERKPGQRGGDGNRLRHATSGKGRGVIVGVIPFDSLRQAADHLRCTVATLAAALEDGRPCAGRVVRWMNRKEVA